jgi:hypothetical protein
MVIIGRSMEGPTPLMVGKLREGAEASFDLFNYEFLKRRAVRR